MRTRGIAAIVSALALALLVSSPAIGQRRDNDKVTGGGQVVLDSQSGFEAAGDTIAFYAEDTGSSGRGQVQYVPTGNEDGEEVSTGRWHGRVTCLEVESDTSAIFAGEARNPDGSTEPFEIRVSDNGQDGTDTILLRKPAASADCSDANENGTDYTLGRGNLTVHNGPS